MSRTWRFIFWIVLLFFIVHTLRDILQILDVSTLLSSSFKTNRMWCRPNCETVTILPETLGILGSSLVLKRNKVGILGITVLLSLIFWPVAVLME